jgi:hypothetical protein
MEIQQSDSSDESSGTSSGAIRDLQSVVVSGFEITQAAESALKAARKRVDAVGTSFGDCPGLANDEDLAPIFKEKARLL